MLHHAVRPLLRVTLLSVLLGAVPSAPMPVVRATADRAAAVAGPPVVPAQAAAPSAPLVAPASTAVPHPEPPPPSLPAHAPITPNRLSTLAPLPLSFVQNTGQFDARVRYQTRGLGGSVFFTPQEIVLAVPTDTQARRAHLHGAKAGVGITTTEILSTSLSIVRLRYEGAGATPTIVPTTQLPGAANYLLGADTSAWRTSLPTYAGITYQQLYPGIDLGYDGTDGHLKSTYTIAAGADPSRIRWRYQGARDVQVDTAGNLRILLDAFEGGRPTATATYTITEHAPVAWQIVNGQRVPVSVRYLVSQNATISFVLGTYDLQRPLIIDPTLVYSLYLGGSSEDEGNAIAVDSAGNAYITGATYSTNFPTTTGAVQVTCGSSTNCADIFVTKLSADGSTRLYSTFLGGTSGDYARSIAVASDGSAYITGRTYSATGFPTTTNAYDRSCPGVIVVKLNAAGSALDYSSCLDGATGYGIAIDSAGKAYVAGETGPGFPTVHAIDTADAGFDAFVAKIDPTASGAASLVYSTYLSGNDEDGAYGIAVDSAGTAYVTGYAHSMTNFPTTAGAYQTANASDPTHPGLSNNYPDAFVTKLLWNASTSTLSYGYSTYLGGFGYDYANGIAIDSAGNAYVTGNTGSNDFPTTSGALDRTYGGNSDYDGFVTKLNVAGSALVYSTYLGGQWWDYANGIAVDSNGQAAIVGYTGSDDFPITTNALKPSIGIGSYYDDAFVTSLTADGSGLRYSSYLGGTEDFEQGNAIAIDGTGSIYVTGETGSSDFPTNPPQTAPGPYPAFVTKIDLTTTPLKATQTRGPEDCVLCTLTHLAAQWFTVTMSNSKPLSSSFTDLAVQSPGPAIVWSRSYASQSTSDLTTTLGFGWQHPYAARLIPPSVANGDVTIISAVGNQLHFASNGNGTYQADGGIYSTLVHANNVYTQTLRDQQQLIFSDTTGRLTGMRDPLGRQLTLTYNAATPPQLQMPSMRHAR